MKYFITAIISVIIGIVLGGVGPRKELRKQQEEAMEYSMHNSKKCSSTIGSDLVQMMGGTGETPSAKTTEPPFLPPEEKVNSLGDRSPDEIASTNPKAVEIAENWDREKEDFDQSLQNIDPADEELSTARAALELRRSQARAALIEGAYPDERQLQQIDEAVQGMNDTLLSLAGEFSEIIEEGEEPERRQVMSFAAEALDTMLTAEERMRDILSEEQIESLDDRALDPFSYISPDIINTLQHLDHQ